MRNNQHNDNSRQRNKSHKNNSGTQRNNVYNKEHANWDMTNDDVQTSEVRNVLGKNFGFSNNRRR